MRQASLRPCRLMVLPALGLLLAAGLLQAQGVPARAAITYLTPSSAYLDAGREDGLVEGAPVEVLRGDSIVALLRVAFVSARRASATIVSRTTELAVGDVVRFTPATPTDDAASPDPEAPTAPVPATVARSAGAGSLHGRLGLRYLSLRQEAGGPSYSQPSVDIRLDGQNLGGTGFGLSADVRARRTSASLADGRAERNESYRVYGLAVTWSRAGTPLRVTVGRQYSAPLASVSLFDGATVEFTRPGWGAGVFAGTQPDPATLGLSTELVEAGGYLQLRSGAGSRRRWSLTGGVIGSYQSGEVNREFFFLSGGLAAGPVSGFLSQEVDYNRGWKTDAGEPTLGLTSTYASVSVRAATGLTIRLGFDSRRNVRLYRDFINPETAFDDGFRRGVWGGISVSTRGGYRVGLDARRSDGGGSVPASSVTLSAGADRLAGTGVTVRARSTRYVAELSRGWLHSAALGVSPGGALRVELNGGLRQSSSPLDAPAQTTVAWYGAEVDLAIGRSWFLLASVSRERGGGEGNDQVYGGISYRF